MYIKLTDIYSCARGPYNRGYLAALRFCGSRETRHGRDPKINLKINLAFLDRGCRVLRRKKDFKGSCQTRHSHDSKMLNLFCGAYIAAAARHRSRQKLGCRDTAIHPRLYGPFLHCIKQFVKTNLAFIRLCSPPSCPHTLTKT